MGLVTAFFNVVGDSENLFKGVDNMGEVNPQDHGAQSIELIDLRKHDYARMLSSKEQYLRDVEQMFPNLSLYFSKTAFAQYAQSGLPGLWDVLWMSRMSSSKIILQDGYIFKFYAFDKQLEEDIEKELKLVFYTEVGVACILMPDETNPPVSTFNI